MTPAPDAPQVSQLADTTFVVWPGAQVAFAFSAWHDKAEGCTAELAITHATTGQEPFWGRTNTTSSQARASVIRAAKEAMPGPDWRRMVEESCRLATKAMRTGEPARELVAVKPGPDRWWVPGLFPLGETSVLYGDGGSAKSMLALALAISALTGSSVGHSSRWAPAAVSSVLYLDWESQYQDHARRLWGLATMHGHGEAPPGIYHRAMTRPLAADVAAVRREVERLKAGLVICDSLGAASGGGEQNWHDSAIAVMNALRSLAPATRLVIAHVSKQSTDAPSGGSGGGGIVRPFGSVYIANLARSTVYCAKSETISGGTDETQGEQSITVTYHHQKTNQGGKQPPSALRFTFDEEGHVMVSKGEIDLSRAGLPTQILDALKAGSKTVASLAEELGAEEVPIRVALNRLEKRSKVIRITDGMTGRGNKTLWGRTIANRNIDT